MPKMRQEIFEVLKKYIKIDSLDEVEFNFDNKNNTSIMEMSVSLEKKPQPLASEEN
jgi:cell division topological specificity factor MinE